MALEEVPILNEVAAEAPARPAKRTKRDTGLNGGYWGSLSAPDDASSDYDDAPSSSSPRIFASSSARRARSGAVRPSSSS